MTREPAAPVEGDSPAPGGAAERGAPPAPSIKRLFANATIYGVGQTLASLLTLATDPLLSYLLTRADFGLIGLTRTTSNLLTNAYRLGLDGATSRIYYDVEHDEGEQRRAIGTINAFLLGWVVLLSLGQELFGPAIYERAFDGLPYAPYGRLVAYGLACNTLIGVAQTVWSAQERAARVVGLRLVAALLTNAVMFALLLGPKLGVLSVLIAQAVAPTILLWVHMRFAWGRFGFAWDPATLRRAFAFGLPMIVHLTSHWALDAADRIMIERYLGRDAVGLYTVAYGSTSTLLMVNGSVNSAYVPQFMRAQGKPGQEGFIARAITYMLLSVIAATLGFVIFAPTVIRALYAARFAEAAPLTSILALAAPLHALYLVYVNGLFHGNRTRMVPVFTLTAGLVNVGLNALWIPRLGIAGAAWATLAGYAALAGLFRLGATTVLPIPLERGRLLRLAGVFILIAALGVLVDGRLPLALELGAKVALALAAPFLLLLSGFLTAEERAVVQTRIKAVLAKVRS
ncbi:lipopolysaccharide biosynthesis protein [Polyangium aurulentum]|uniref:lipopolysaccharide biosynthesis protein n=1 Tax=Polyangium aurulentum TaxID=2567896 RepID=UPI0010ADEC7C|nr:oligosaccharide flippase family protein [Polyangium aurulentum]UQA58064.1 oligosaccharide flippase family protein [Polyangium aurulentum]